MNKCLNCQKETKTKFCSKSCAAIYNNKRRKWSIEVKEKISNSLMGRKLSEEHKSKCIKILNEVNRLGKNIKKGAKIVSEKEIICKICGKVFKTKYRKTCSKECQTVASVKIRSYQNGSRKSIWFTSKYAGKVLLESSWEVEIANFLDNNNINWIRPKHLKWEDINGKIRLYFPDFYLIDAKIYIDPKNPYCIKRDEYKIKYFKNKIKLYYGNVDYLKKIIIRECSVIR